MSVPNVLAERYASAEMRLVFDPVERVIAERRFWVAVMRAQADLGLDIPTADIAAYEAVIDQVDLQSIADRERVSRHDVKARIDEFSALAGVEHAHKGMTSRDLTENVESMLTFRALEVVSDKTVALLARWAELAAEYAGLAIVGRTHNVPAQPTTVGKRIAQFAEELLIALEVIDGIRDRFAIRGIKGPVGSQQDQLDLLGTAEAAEELERRVASELGVPRVLTSVGQVTPRSRDFEVVAALVQLSSAPANLALQIRLMAGHDLATEGFAEGQVGSSAMPHKMNSRSCERVNGFHTILRGHLTMAANLTGDQWNEGDVSCSVVRRVMIPDSFFAIDGLLETSLSIAGGLGFFPAVIDAELRRYLPFVATPTLLAHAVRNGVGREEAHEIIKEHAVAAALAMRQGAGSESGLLARLADDDRFPGDEGDIAQVVADPAELLGRTQAQVGATLERIQAVIQERPEVARYAGTPIL
ncbi:MAG: adenylosuccinate lyase [Acidimicrobiales bacterium]|nr:adenylosuccinate lyase [Acidimicrobiales bacterium]